MIAQREYGPTFVEVDPCKKVISPGGADISAVRVTIAHAPPGEDAPPTPHDPTAQADLAIVQLVAPVFGLGIPNSGSWWAISVVGTFGGLIIMNISYHARR